MPKIQVIHDKGGLENGVWEEMTIAAPGPGEVHICTLAIDMVLR